MKRTLLFSFIILAFVCESKAQVSAGIYRLSSGTFASIGSNPDLKMFGEARVSTGSNIGIEGTFGYNFVQKEDVNFYSGFHLGIHGSSSQNDNFYLGVPLGLLIKPFSASRNVGFLLEASPVFPTGTRDNYFRAGIGLKYTFN